MAEGTLIVKTDRIKGRRLGSIVLGVPLGYEAVVLFGPLILRVPFNSRFWTVFDSIKMATYGCCSKK